MKSRIRRRGYTLIELLMVIGIMAMLATIVAPRITLILERAHQGKTKGQLGSLRSAIQLYYSDTEGRIAFQNHPNGLASDTGESLAQVIVPTYIHQVPTPFISDPFQWPPATGLSYDSQAKINMALNPPNDIAFFTGPPQALFYSRPYVYDPTSGHVYICDGNYDVAGQFYYHW